MPAPAPPLQVDASNRSDHFYLVEGDECFFFHEYTPKKGFGHSTGNQLIANLKKSVLLRHEPQYKWKNHAIAQSKLLLRSAFDSSPWVYEEATFAPIPPSKVPSHEEYDDRMTQIVRGACVAGSDVRQFVQQGQGYEASHRQADGQRLKPQELEAIYSLDVKPPKSTVILVDDMLTTGAHFVAARNTIRSQYPEVRVIGFFITRRILANPFDDFNAF